jgi:hypothetical protein
MRSKKPGSSCSAKSERRNEEESDCYDGEIPLNPPLLKGEARSAGGILAATLVTADFLLEFFTLAYARGFSVAKRKRT